MYSQKQNEAHQRYRKKATRTFTFEFHRVNDEDVVLALESADNKTNYIRELIRNDVRQKKKTSRID